MSQDTPRPRPDDDRVPLEDRVPPEEQRDRDPPPSPRDPHGPHAPDRSTAGAATDTGTGPSHHPPPPADGPVPPSPRDAHGPHAGRPVMAGIGRTVTVVYVLYLVGVFVPVVMLIGAVIALVKRSGGTTSEQTHYTFQIQTFVGAVLAWLVAAIVAMLIPVLVPLSWLVMLALAFWVAIRAVKGMAWAGRGDPVPHPTDWKFGGGGTSRPDAGDRRPPP